MKITKATVKNYRLLHNVTVALNEKTTTIVGKNNSGKTSFTTIFDIFLNKKRFHFHDFSIQAYQDFLDTFQNFGTDDFDLEAAQISIPKIQLFLTIQYDEKDNWSNLRPFITSLEDTDTIEILFEYAPESTLHFLKTIKETVEEDADNEAIIYTIESLFSQHYKIKLRPISDVPDVSEVGHSEIFKLIQSKFIYAQRALDDSGEDAKSKLSKVFQTQYYNESKNNVGASDELLSSIKDAGDAIDIQLEAFFSTFLGIFEQFGFPGLGDEKVELRSQLQPETLFRNNIKLFYNQNGSNLPERYNGLGYSNLIYIISQIIGFHKEKEYSDSSVNLIFIEEPEAHMHPQMQSVFIAKINAFLESVGMQAQVVLTTHSSHILSNSSFDCIRYFLRCQNSPCASKIKDLTDFKVAHTTDEEKETVEFLEQYLTLGKCDLFFADKSIFFEGTVERILLPIFIEKSEPKLLEEYITTIEVGGTYMHHFRELLHFLELKTLIITDIDSVKKDSPAAIRKSKCPVKLGDTQTTSNQTLKQWLPGETNIDNLLVADIVKEGRNNLVRVSYQTLVGDEPDRKCGRSFEEAFILENSKYIFDNRNSLKSIKNILPTVTNAQDVYTNSYDIQNYIDKNKKKTDFAFELLTIHQDEWDSPTYIKEGLSWLAK